MMTLSCAESCNIYEINALYTYGKSSVYTPRKTYTTFVVQYSGKGDFLGQHAGVQDIFIFSPFGNGKEVDAVEKEATYCAQVRTDSISSQVRNKPTCHSVCVLVFPLFSCNSPPRAPVASSAQSNPQHCSAHTHRARLLILQCASHSQTSIHTQTTCYVTSPPLTHSHTLQTQPREDWKQSSPTTHCKLKINQR